MLQKAIAAARLITSSYELPSDVFRPDETRPQRSKKSKAVKPINNKRSFSNTDMDVRLLFASCIRTTDTQSHLLGRANIQAYLISLISLTAGLTICRRIRIPTSKSAKLQTVLPQTVLRHLCDIENLLPFEATARQQTVCSASRTGASFSRCFDLLARSHPQDLRTNGPGNDVGQEEKY